MVGLSRGVTGIQKHRIGGRLEHLKGKVFREKQVGRYNLQVSLLCLCHIVIVDYIMHK